MTFLGALKGAFWQGLGCHLRFEVAMAPVKNQDAFVERNGQVPWIHLNPFLVILARDRKPKFFTPKCPNGGFCKGNVPYFRLVKYYNLARIHGVLGN